MTPLDRVRDWLRRHDGFPDDAPTDIHSSFQITYGDLRAVVAELERLTPAESSIQSRVVSGDDDKGPQGGQSPSPKTEAEG